MTHPAGPESAYQRTPLSAKEKARGEASFVPANGREIVITFAQEEPPGLAGRAPWKHRSNRHRPEPPDGQPERGSSPGFPLSDQAGLR